MGNKNFIGRFFAHVYRMYQKTGLAEMDLADVWDRFFWSAVYTIFVGLVWLKFLDPVISFVWVGVIVSVAVGVVYFRVWWRRTRRELKMSELTEKEAMD